MSNSEKRGLQASVDGFAHEHITVGILMKRYQNVSKVTLPLSSYDIIIARKNSAGKEDIVRVQVKTASKGISFIGGVRGGADRTYKSDVKKYTQSTVTSDCVIGLHPRGNDSFDLYFVPTCLIENLHQNSISLKKIEPFKNNYEILERCKDKEFILQKARESNIV